MSQRSFPFAPPAAAAAKRVLHLHLKAKWFDEIASGAKSHEFRLANPFWEQRQTITHEEFGREPVEVFAIAVAEKNLENSCSP